MTLESMQINKEEDNKIDKSIEANVMTQLGRIEASGVDFSHLLIFFTSSAKLQVDRKPERRDSYRISSQHEKYNIGESIIQRPSVRASPTWRSKQPEYLDFIALSTKGISLYGEYTQTDFATALIEWVEGIAYRVGAQTCVIPRRVWLDYDPEEKLIVLA